MIFLLVYWTIIFGDLTIKCFIQIDKKCNKIMTNKDKKLQGIQIDDIEVEDVSYIYIIINTLL